VTTASQPAEHADNHTYRLNPKRNAGILCEWPDCTHAATIATDQPGIPWGQLLLCDAHARETLVDDIDATDGSDFARQLAKNLARAVKDADDAVWAEIGRAMLGRAIEWPSSMFISDIDVVADATGVPMDLLLFGSTR
jgi:hypothetical protein